MARKKRAKELQPNIKVRLDRRTVITVRDEEKLAFWKEKYPELEVLESWKLSVIPSDTIKDKFVPKRYKQKKAGFFPAFFCAPKERDARWIEKVN